MAHNTLWTGPAPVNTLWVGDRVTVYGETCIVYNRCLSQGVWLYHVKEVRSGNCMLYYHWADAAAAAFLADYAE